MKYSSSNPNTGSSTNPDDFTGSWINRDEIFNGLDPEWQHLALDTFSVCSDISSIESQECEYYSQCKGFDMAQYQGTDDVPVATSNTATSANLGSSDNEKPFRDGESIPRSANGSNATDDFAIPPVLQRTSTKASIEDPDFVTWDGDDDPSNPHNWPKHRQWTSLLLVSMFTFISPMASTMIAPALNSIAKEFDITSPVEQMFVLAIFLLAYAVGPFLWGPMSEVFGRVKVLQLANLIFLIFNTVCGFAQTKQQMMIFRFLSGIGGSAPQAIGNGVLADVFRVEERGAGIAVYSLMPFISPAIAPIMGAYLTQYTTWRWVFWSTSIFDLAVQVLCVFFLRETHAPAILAAKVRVLRKSTGNPSLHTKWQGPDHSMRKILMKALVRPFIMIGTQPALQAMAIFRAYQYGLMHLALATFPMVFENSYNMSVSVASLNYLSLGIGFVIGLQISGTMQDKIYQSCRRQRIDPAAPIFARSTWSTLYTALRTPSKSSSSMTHSLLPSYATIPPTHPITIPRKPLNLSNSLSMTTEPLPPGLPEYRLPLTLPFSLLIATGLFIYGFSAASQTHWIVPNLGACIFAIGLIICFNCAQAYVVDTYTTYAASASGAAAFVRTMAGFGFPLFAPDMFRGLGVGWGNGVLGFVCLVLGIVGPVVLWRWGKWLRGRSTYCVG